MGRIANTVYLYSIRHPNEETTIRILDTPRLHRQRKGRRKTVHIMNSEELAAHFGLPADVEAHRLELALHEADWPYHRDAAGRLWSVAPEEGK